MAIFGSLKTVRAQTSGRNENYKTAFDYIDDCLKPGTDAHKLIHNLAAGDSDRVELGNGAFALPQAYLSKAPRETGFFESHLAYVDVQAIISGEEIVEVTDVANLKVKEDRTPAQDAIIYEMHDEASPVRLRAGEVAVLDPVDGHMPCIAIKEPALIRKIVVKIPVA
ncbi:biofilm protein TabA [Ereboglobus sp. PH5-10]|uniref:YhcH/YjgK/YiaL family protein n=1 Tax=Ereboglobus sp. PH5-10 TaxID=2940629 RepID=UPI002406687A|nr:YhcH/YjgK/YiaL family protein [Ereboglobus sp. PH5-10]MDF9827165.1 biofilm protein TabA [Ereboglobus sp. PH5-10]